MIRLLTIIFFLSLISLQLESQAQTISATTYPLTIASGAALAAEEGTVTQLLGPGFDNGTIPYASVKPIGFDFWFANVKYINFSVAENGILKLGGVPVYNTAVNNLALTTNNPRIAPYWDDLATGSNGSVKYWLAGTAPNRKLVVQWNVTVPKSTTNPANATFQVWLNENHSIDFIYGDGLLTNAGNYSVGIGGATASTLASITTTDNSISYTTANNSNTAAILNGTKYTFTSNDIYVPLIVSTQLANTYDYTNRTVTATISDQSGVPSTGTLLPRIYYKKMFNGSFVSTQGVLTNSATNEWTFTIDNSLIGGVTGHDSVYYFIVAQDISTTPNISTLPAGGVATDVNTISTYPSTLYKYLLGAQLSGTLTVGATGADYSSITNAGGLFDDINNGLVLGNLQINIISDPVSESGTFSLNTVKYSTGGPFTININPVGNITVSGTGSITLNGATNVIIDGLNNGSNSLTISSTGYSISTLILKNGASNNIIKNLTLRGTVSSSGGVIAFGDGSATSGNSYNVIKKCLITAGSSSPYSGIYMYPYSGMLSTNNIIDSNVISNFSYRGIHLYRLVGNITISNNEIYQSIPGSAYSTGIYIDQLPGTSYIYNNKIHDIYSTINNLGADRAGIWYAYGATTEILNIYNNEIILDAVQTGSNDLFGIYLQGGGTSNIYFNSIYIGGNATNISSYGISKTGGTVNLKNNVIFNARSVAAPSQYYKNYGLHVPSVTNFTSDYNVVYVNGISGVFAAYNTTDYFSLAAWSTASSQDMHSYSANPGFTSTTNLKPDTNNVNSAILNNRGIGISFINSDIEGNTRSNDPVNGTPDIGAYEFNINLITISGNTELAGVTLTWEDIVTRTTTSDSLGNYSISVGMNWTGRVTPSLTNTTFSPLFRDYTNLQVNQTNQDFIVLRSSITGNTGMPGVTLSWKDVIDKTIISDSLGNYKIVLPYNWSGVVIPTLFGYYFTPESRTYNNLIVDTINQNYAASRFSWETFINIKDNGNQNKNLYFGQSAIATDSLDAALLEFPYPPPPLPGTFDASFVLTSDYTIKDYRNDTSQVIIWRMNFQPGSGGYPFTFTWDPTMLPEGTFRLKDPINGSLVNVDMLLTNSYSLTNTNLNSLIIEHTKSISRIVVLDSGWNISSIPVKAINMNSSSLFPALTAPIYEYNNGYLTTTSLLNGKGYWIFSDSLYSNNIQGMRTLESTIPVIADWNLIGIYNYNVNVDLITSTPSNNILSPFYGFANGYVVPTQLEVGKGYWIKVQQNGTLNIPFVLTKNSRNINIVNHNPEWSKLTFTDLNGRSGSLYQTDENIEIDKYDLPPLPPVGIFDVRYFSNRNVENNSGWLNAKINSAVYPVKIEAVGGNYQIKDNINGKLFNITVLDGQTVSIDEEYLNSFSILKFTNLTEVKEDLLPTEYSLSQNYPNPFNPTTTLNFSLPEKSLVKIIIFNQLGEKVQVVVNEEMDAGYHQVKFNAEGFSSGIYFYQLQANSFNSVKKMIFMK